MARPCRAVGKALLVLRDGSLQACHILTLSQTVTQTHM